MFYKKQCDAHTHTKETIFILKMLEPAKEFFVSNNEKTGVLYIGSNIVSTEYHTLHFDAIGPSFQFFPRFQLR